MSLRIRRGTDTQRSSIVFDPGELAWCLDTRKLYVGDGLTPGGVNVLAHMAGVGVSFNSGTQALDFSQGNLTLTTADIAEDPSRLYYTDVRAKDAVGAMLQAGSNTGITFSYDSSSHAITVNSTGHQLPTASLPGDAGKYLTLDNSGNPVWHNPPIQGGLSLPSFGGTEIGKYLTTDGTYLVWADVAINSLVNGAFHVDLDSAGNLKTSGTIKLPSTADIVRETGVSTGIYTSVLGGLGSVSADTSPSLGGNLSAGSYNISNVGTLSATTLSATTVTTATVSATTVSATTVSATQLSTNTTSIKSDGSIVSTYFSQFTDPLLSIGTTSSPNTLSITSTKEFLQLNGVVGNSGGAPAITNQISRGTLTVPLAVQSNDALSLIRVFGYDGSNYVISGAFGMGVDPASPVTTGSVPGAFFVKTVGASGPYNLTFNSNGIFSVPVVQTGSFSGSGSYPTPTAGMIIFDSQTNHFVGYDGSSWKQLDN